MWVNSNSQAKKIDAQLRTLEFLEKKIEAFPETMHFLSRSENGSEQKYVFDFKLNFGPESLFTKLPDNKGYMKGISQIPGEVTLATHTYAEYEQSGFHVHDHVEIFTVMSGHCLFEIKRSDGRIQDYELNPGESLIIPTNLYHNYKNPKGVACDGIIRWSYFYHYPSPKLIFQKL